MATNFIWVKYVVKYQLGFARAREVLESLKHSVKRIGYKAGEKAMQMSCEKVHALLFPDHFHHGGDQVCV